MAKRGKRSKKKQTDNLNLQVVVLIIFSIVLGVLIYTKAGVVGEYITPFLGGILGPVKYVLPIGIFFVGIYTAYGDREYLTRKFRLVISIKQHNSEML